MPIQLTWDVIIEEAGTRRTRRLAGGELTDIHKVRAAVEKTGAVFVSAESVNPAVTPDPEAPAETSSDTKSRRNKEGPRS